MLEKGKLCTLTTTVSFFLYFLLKEKKKVNISKFETCLLICRLRIFNQLEEELNSHQHELHWLMDKAKQIAQKDITLASEMDKEINRLQSLWEDTKKVIHEK